MSTSKINNTVTINVGHYGTLWDVMVHDPAMGNLWDTMGKTDNVRNYGTKCVMMRRNRLVVGQNGTQGGDIVGPNRT